MQMESIQHGWTVRKEYDNAVSSSSEDLASATLAGFLASLLYLFER